MNEEVNKYYYKLSGNDSAFVEVQKRAESVKGVYKTELEGDVLLVELGAWASEYDLFRALNDFADGCGVEVDYAETDAVESEEISPESVAQTLPQDSAEDEKTPENAEEKKIPDEEKSWKRKYIPNYIELGVAAVMLVIAALIDAGNAQTFLCLIAFAFVGYEIIWDAITAIAKKDFFNYNIAMVVASVAALFLSDAKYTEVAFIVLLFEAEITLAKILKDVRTEKIKKRLYYSYDQVRIAGNDDEMAFAKDVAVGSLVRFASGETIAFDGVVSEGECRADTYNVSGEKKTVALVSGDCVRSGWTVTEGEIVLSVKKTAEESFARRLYDKVVGSQESDYSAKTRKFAKFALPVSLAAALVIAFLVPLFLSFGGRTYSESLPVWAYASVMFFAVCNTFGVVVPLAISRESAVYRALSLNVFAPSQNEFLAVAEADTAVFVEPGALTDTEVDRYKVIAKPAYKGRLIDLLSEYGVSLSAVADGEIVKGNKNGSVLTAGTYAALVNEGISVKELNVKGNVKYVAVDGEVAGAFSFESPLKKNAYGAVRELKDAGVRSVVLSDDAEHLSDLGVEVRPIADENDETVFVEKTTVCVGAPIARAYIMIKDTDEYLNAENGAYIPDGDVKSVAKYIKLAKRYKKALKTNAVISVVAKVVALITGFVLLFAVPFNAMWVAVLIDSLAGTLVTLNAFRCGAEVY